MKHQLHYQFFLTRVKKSKKCVWQDSHPFQHIYVAMQTNNTVVDIASALLQNLPRAKIQFCYHSLELMEKPEHASLATHVRDQQINS